MSPAKAKTLKRFTNGQHVEMVEADDQQEPLMGKRGHVVRLRMADSGAWVEMDEDLPEDLQSFVAGDSRHRHIRLYPDQCIEAKSF
jgi:hypothetical protein